MTEMTAVNNCTTNPALVIKSGGTSPVVSFSTFYFKVNGRSMGVAGADAPSLALATYASRPFLNGVAQVVGSIAFDDGTVPVDTKSCQIFQLVATSAETEAGTVTMSWIAGEAFPKHRQAQASDVPQPNSPTSVGVGTLYIKNETNAVFIPGTTNLDTGSVTTHYTNNY